MSTPTTTEFYVDVKKLEGDVWVAKIADVEVPEFKDVSEEAVREQVRLHLLGFVASATGKPVDALQARLKRTWRVRVVEKESASSRADEDDMPLFDLFA